MDKVFKHTETDFFVPVDLNETNKKLMMVFRFVKSYWKTNGLITIGLKYWLIAHR